MIRQVRQGVLAEVEDREAAISIVAKELLEYKRLHREAGHTFDYKPVEEVIETLDRTCMILLVEDQYLLILKHYEVFFSYDKVLEEVILKRYSKGTVGLSYILSVMETIGKQLGCTRLQLGTLGQSGKTLPRLYSRHGFVESGFTMTKEI